MSTRRYDKMASEFMRYKQVTGTKLVHLTVNLEHYEAKFARLRRRVCALTLFMFLVGLCIGAVLTAYVLRSP